MKEVIEVSLSAVKLSAARQYVKGWDKGRYAELFKKHASGPNAYRVYIPMEQVGGTAAIKVPPKVQEIVESKGYVIDDYRAGIAATKDGKRRIRIGKLLTGDPETKKAFDNDKARTGFRSKYIICISRHPYDIVGASTDRGWVSCMDLDGGSNRSYLKADVEHGSLIAYLIEEHDRNINRPAGRILIKPYVAGKETVLLCDMVYGADVQGFRVSVQRWLDKNFNHGKTSGKYVLHDDLYNDTKSTRYHFTEMNEKVIADLNKDAQIRREILTNHPEALFKLKTPKFNDVIAAMEHSLQPAFDFFMEKFMSKKPARADLFMVARKILINYPEMFDRVIKEKIWPGSFTAENAEDMLHSSTSPDLLRYLPKAMLKPEVIIAYAQGNAYEDAQAAQRTINCLPEQWHSETAITRLAKLSPAFFKVIKEPSDTLIKAFVKNQGSSLGDNYWDLMNFDSVSSERRVKLISMAPLEIWHYLPGYHGQQTLNDPAVMAALFTKKLEAETRNYSVGDFLHATMEHMEPHMWSAYDDKLKDTIVRVFSKHAVYIMELLKKVAPELMAKAVASNLMLIMQLDEDQLKTVVVDEAVHKELLKMASSQKTAVEYSSVTRKKLVFKLLIKLLDIDAKLATQILEKFAKNMPTFFQFQNPAPSVTQRADLQKAVLIDPWAFSELIPPTFLSDASKKFWLELDEKTLKAKYGDFEKKLKAVKDYQRQVKILSKG